MTPRKNQLARGILIRRWREHAGLTQVEIAHRIGVAQSSYAQWETGRSTPTLDHLEQFASLVGATLDQFWRGPRGARA